MGQKHATTVADLRALLEGFDDDMPVSVAPTPDINGWSQPILDLWCLVRRDGGTALVLALAETTMTEEEEKLIFTDGEQNHVRPV